MNPKMIQTLFILAGVSNIAGVLICSRLFTNQVMMQAQPSVMGFFGLICIILWGLAYIAVRKSYANVPWLIGVFVVEKAVYVAAWLVFLSTQSLSEVYGADLLAGVFYSIYGVNDFLFMLFFGYVFIAVRKGASGTSHPRTDI